MTYAERELLKAVAAAVAVLVSKCPTGGGYHQKQINEKLQRLNDYEIAAEAAALE